MSLNGKNNGQKTTYSLQRKPYFPTWGTFLELSCFSPKNSIEVDEYRRIWKDAT